MKRKVNDNLVKPISKKLRKGGSENQVNGDNGVKSNFQVKQFRKKLKEADFITEFYHFLQAAQSDSTLIAAYVECGGQPMEMVTCLERIDKDFLAHISCVFQVLQLVYIEILSKSQQLTEIAVSSAKFLLNKHRRLIEKVLESSLPSHKISVLRLLTAVVTLEARLGFDVLKLFKSVVQSEFQLEHFTRLPKKETAEESIRTSFIHFIMAFFIEGNNVLIRNVMDKQEFIKAFLLELHLDKDENIVLVLGTLKSFLLKNPVVSKSQKFMLFSEHLVRNLLKIYSQEDRKADEISRGKTIQAVQDFLILLLSSYKYGIAVQCLGFKKMRNNVVPKDVLRDLIQPWKRLGQTELVIQVLKACPELTGFYLKMVSKQMDINQIDNFLKILEFIGNLIESLSPKSVIRSGSDNASSSEMANLVRDICLSSDILDKIRDKAVKNDNLSIRLATTVLLKKMFVQLKSYFKALESFAGLRNMKFEIFGHIFQKFPSVDNIIHSLYQTINQKSVDKELVLEHLEITIDVLLAAMETVASFIEKTSNLINYLQILNPIYSDTDGEGSEHKSRIELKTIKLILLLDPQVLAANTDLFQHIMKSFINVYVHGDKESQIQVRPLLRDVLLNTGLFENGVLEIDLWLESFLHVDLKHLDSVVQYFVKLILNLKENRTDLDEDSTVELKEDIKMDNFKDILQNIANDRTISGVFDVPVSTNMLKSALKSSKKIQQSIHLQKYFETLLFYYVHFLPENQMTSIGGLIKNKNFIIENYLLTWFNSNQVIFPDEFEHKTINNLLTNIYNGEIDDAETPEPVENVTKSMITVYGIIFFVNQLNRIGKMTTEIAQSAAKKVVDLLKVVKNEDQVTEGSLELKVKPTATQNEEETSLKKTEPNLELILKYIFHSQIELLRGTEMCSGKEKNEGLVLFVMEIIKFVKESSDKDKLLHLTKNYRSKFVQAIRKSKDQEESGKTALELFNLFDWDFQENVDLLEILLETTSETELSEKSTLKLELMSELLKKLPDFKTEQDLIRISNVKVEKILSIFQIMFVHEDTERFEEMVGVMSQSLMKLLKLSRNRSCSIYEEIFTMIYNSETSCKSSISFMSFLLDINYTELQEKFISLLSENYKKKELTYPLLEVAFRKGIEFQDKNLIKSIFNEYKTGILKSIDKPNKAGMIYKDFAFTSGKLLQLAIPIKECQEWCRKMIKSDVVEPFQCDLVRILHQKSIQESAEQEQKDQFVEHFVATLLNFCQILFKRNDVQKFDYITELMVDWLKEYKAVDRNWETLCESPNWSLLCKNCLKFGMQKNEGDETKNESLLNLMTTLVETFYPLGEYPDMGQYYEMAFSHSEFFDTMLGTDLSRKFPLVRVLFALACRSEKTIFHKNHVPIILGAYSAKIQPCDRVLLAMINLYEYHGVNLGDFKPFLWGEAAISHYSLREIENFESFQVLEISNADQVFSLIDNDAMKNTLSNFPIWRRLNPLEDIPEIVLKRNKSDQSKPAIENLIDSGKAVPDLQLRLVSRKEEAYYQSYDPAFFVPLMAMVFCPESNNSTVAVAQNGMLALVFEALSSYDNEMRMAAGLAMVRYRRQLEGKKSFLDQQVWGQFFAGVSKGLEAIKQKDEHCPRVSHISAVFLAKATIILTQPLLKMYKPMSDYVLSKDTYDFATVPNFNFLFLSPDIEHQSYREFLLEIVQDGLKCEEDFDILDASGILETLMAFFSCPFANIATNLRILNIINTIIKIPNANKILMEKYGLFVWLNGIVTNLETFYFDTIEALVHLVSNMFYSTKSLEANFSNFSEMNLKLFFVTKKLFDVIILGHTSMKSIYKVKIFVKLLNIFNYLLNENNVDFVSAEDITRFVKFGAHFCVSEEDSQLVTLVNHAKENEQLDLIEGNEFSKSLKDDDTSMMILKLRVLVVNWLTLRQ